MAVAVAVGVNVAVAVAVGVAVDVAVGLGVNVAVGVKVAVAVGVSVAVAVAVGVGVNVAVAVGVGVGAAGWSAPMAGGFGRSPPSKSTVIPGIIMPAPTHGLPSGMCRSTVAALPVGFKNCGSIEMLCAS